MAKRKQDVAAPGAPQPQLWKPESSWTAPDPSLWPSLRGHKAIGLDTETKDPRLKELGPGVYRKDGMVVGISLSWGDPGSYGGLYLPIAHEGQPGANGNLDPAKVLAYLAHELEHFDGEVVGANILYDLGWLAAPGHKHPGVHLRQAKFVDVQWTQALLDENMWSYALKNLLKHYGLPPKDETLLNQAAEAFGIDPKGGLWQLPCKFVGAYGERDAVSPLELWVRQKPLIEAEKLENVWKLEHDNLPLLHKMRQQGVRVDLAKVEQLKKHFQRQEMECTDYIKWLTGVEVDLWSAVSLAKAFEAEGIKYGLTPTGKPSFTAEYLDGLEHPLGKAVGQARAYNKAWSTFCEGQLQDHAIPIPGTDYGRIHGEFHPLRTDEAGTVGGRFSMTNPNLQQAPIRHPEIGPLYRQALVPEEGQLWAAPDYSQQEPRVGVHFAEKLNLAGAKEIGDTYRENPKVDYHQLVADMVGIPRKPAKTINLGLDYGMGPPKLCRSLGLPTKWVERRGRKYEVAGDEGMAIIIQYHEKMPYKKKMGQICMDVAKERGYIITLAGRRCRFNLYEPARGYGPAFPYEQAVQKYGSNVRRAYTHKAYNRLVQGSSADMIKMAMRDLHQAYGVVPLLSIHDELGLSVDDRAQAEKYADVMRNCVQLTVPMQVDVEVGPNWCQVEKED